MNDVVIAKPNYLLKHCKVLSDSIHRSMNTFLLSKKPFQRLLHSEDADWIDEITIFKKNLFPNQIVRNERQETSRADEENNKLYDSYLPLKIIDKKLGYRINVFLEKDRLLKKINEYLTFPPKASCYFENADTLFENQHIELNRLETYEGSLLQFSRALFYGRTIEEGFSFYKKHGSLPFVPERYLLKKEREEIVPTNLVYTKSSEGTTVEMPDWIEVHHLLPASSSTRIFRLYIPSK